MPNERKSEFICFTRDFHVNKGVMPTLAVANNLQLADIPPELSNLNILERHLVARCITFAKMTPLPKGRQRAIHDNVVCVPSEVQETVNALKRRLCYRGHQLFQTVTWSKLIRALHKLKEIHPQYKDITIRDEALLCNPTLPDPDEDDDDDVNETMCDEDYDADDMMQIDRFESDALCEEEPDPENEQQNNDTLVCDDGQSEEQTDDADQKGDMPNGGIILESCLQPRDVSEDILSFSEGIYSVAPAERNSPVSFFKTPKLEAVAFPVQFPTGENTLDEERPIKVTPNGLFQNKAFWCG